MQHPQRHTFALFGATGGIGLQLARRALAAGHRVRALVRDPAKLDAIQPHARLEVLRGDATDPDAVRRTVRGADAVLCALGAPALSRSRVRSAGTAAIVDAMKAEGVDRIVAVSVFGVFETRATLPFFLRYIIFPLYLSRAVADHERQEEVLQRSGLRWTAVRPPNLVDTDETDVVHGPGSVDGMTMTVSRHAVAAFMLDQVDRDDYVGTAPSISFPDPRHVSTPAAEPYDYACD